MMRLGSALVACTPAPSAPAEPPASPEVVERDFTPVAPMRPEEALVLSTNHMAFVQRGDGGKTARLQIGRRMADGRLSWSTHDDPGVRVSFGAARWRGGFLSWGAEEARVNAWQFDGGGWRSTPAFLGDWPSVHDGVMDTVVDTLGERWAAGTYDHGHIIVGQVDGKVVQTAPAQAVEGAKVSSVEWLDVDADGDEDLLVARARGLRGEVGDILLYVDGDVAKAPQIVWTADDWFTRELRLFDADGDGMLDVVGLRPGLEQKGAKRGEVHAAGAQLVRFDRSTVPWAPKPLAVLPAPLCHSATVADVVPGGPSELILGCTHKGLYVVHPGAEVRVEAVDAEADHATHPVVAFDVDGDGVLEIVHAAMQDPPIGAYQWAPEGWRRSPVVPVEPKRVAFSLAAIR